jgi:tRNA 2-selenouridine synthase
MNRSHLPPPEGIDAFDRYALIIDARTPHEYDEDHLPGAVNLPVVDDAEFAEVGITHKADPHAAYLVGAQHALRNIATHLQAHGADLAALPRDARVLVYCFRGGKRSRVWADTLKTIGYRTDVLPGGWKAYRAWVRESLDALPAHFTYRVLSGATGCGKTRLLHALRAVGAQVLDLEGIARHRGSLIGSWPGVSQPTQKSFDTDLVQALLELDPTRPVWVEAESKKIGNVQLPDALHAAMHATAPHRITAPMVERVKVCREDYPNLVADPEGMMRTLDSLRPLVGGEEFERWAMLARERRTDELFERLMVAHYDPSYARTTQRSYKGAMGPAIELASVDRDALLRVAAALNDS